ncbi:MAG TPA: bifunctional aldolase/short-chain dehydrogenase [Polyangiaceae bacterium]|nr:bifunctional aldolase/short-chain dehydrogenase [Polyangiaceae bacterium]
MRSRFSKEDSRAAVAKWGAVHGEALAHRVYTSRLLGAEPSLVLHGGGNTSVKAVAREIAGATTDVVFVKGSGWDLATIEPAGFPACRLAPLLECLKLPELSDEDMVRALRSQMLDPSSPTPSVEALLHAFLPGRVVDHTHANAVLTVVDQPDGPDRAREIWGDDVLIVPYVMPGFALARKVAELGERVRGRRIMVLDKHGIFTWGDSAEESYTTMLDAVTRAEDYVARARSRSRAVRVPVASIATGATGATNATDATSPSRDDAAARRLRRRVTPIVRGAIARASGGAAPVLEWRDEPAILALAAHSDGRALSQIGPMTPDHVLRTKPAPAWIGSLSGLAADAIREAAENELSRFGAEYAAYFDANAGRYAALKRLDGLPRLFLSPALGALTVGKTLDEARITGDVYAHTAEVILDATVLGRYRPVERADLFDVEYWSLEQAKLANAKPSGGPLARKIALVTGAARGIGRATAEHFLELGAHVLLSDLDGEALARTSNELSRRSGTRVAHAAADVTARDGAEELVGTCVDAFGGLDVVVSNAGNAPSGLLHTEAGEAAFEKSLELNLVAHQRVARAATDVFLAQGIGGCLLFNASKSAFNPGRDFGPYAVPKAALVALMRQYAVDLGKDGVRANAVNADRIRTALFDGIVEARAKARGVSPDEYFRDNLLHRETTATDVARAFAFLATAEATTGSVVTVDGGNAAAFPR